MARICGKYGLIVWLLALLLGAAARAVDPVPIDFMPSGPIGGNRFQPFSQCGILPYGDRDKARSGWFVQVDWLDWWNRAPKKVPVGYQNPFAPFAFAGPVLTVPPFTTLGVHDNTIDTGFIGHPNARGYRFDFGFVNDGHGLLVSVLDVKPFQSQFQALQPEILFRDELLEAVRGPLPPQAWLFDHVTVTNTTRVQGVEVMPFLRSDQRHAGGYWDFLYGVRLFRFRETFLVDAPTVLGWSNAIADQSIPTETFVFNRALNNLVGPQLGLRWFRERGKIMLSAEGRAMAAWNMQEVKQEAFLDLRSVVVSVINGQSFVMPSSEVTNTRHFNTFSPLAEARLNASYQITSRLLIQAGWTGIFASNIARPNTMIDYGYRNFGILPRNKQEIFVQGLNVGIVFNR